MVTVVGTLLGASVTMEMLASASGWWLPLLGVLVLVAAGAVACMLFFRFVVRFDWRTAYFAGMPGGIVEMITLGAAFGGDIRRIAIVHSSRILLTVFLVPFLLQALSNGTGLAATLVQSTASGADHESWLLMALSCVVGYCGGRLLHLPAPELMGPLIFSAALHLLGVTSFATPAFMVATAQLVIGSSIGCRFAGTRTGEVLVLFAYGAGSVALLLFLSVGIALAVAALSGFSQQLLVLAYAPGGLTEMSLIALAMNFDVSLVIVLHVARILLVALGAGPVLALAGARPAANAGSGALPTYIKREQHDE
jgi:membrane AbrB-like protein